MHASEHEIHAEVGHKYRKKCHNGKNVEEHWSA
jgi:hypothetical protein